MRRLYLQVYFTIVASLVLVVLTAGLLWHFSTSFSPFGQQFEGGGGIIARLLPPVRAYAEPMGNKAPAKPQTKKTGKSLQEKRAAKQAKKSEKKGGSSS